MAEPSATILVVEDTPTKRYILSSWLRRAGHQVVEAGTGEEALLMLASERPDLVVLDVRLPGLDGYAVCERIKADPATASIPVIQVSANAVTVADRTEGLERGADAYLPDPIEPDEFTAIVVATLRYSRARRRAEVMAARLAKLAETTLLINRADSFERLLSVAVEGTAEILDRFAGALAVPADGRPRRYRARPGGAVISKGVPPSLLERLAAIGLGQATGAEVIVLPPGEWHRLVPDSEIGMPVTGVLCRTRKGRPPIFLGVEAEPELDADEVNLLRQLAQELALAVDARRAYTEEHAISITLQRSLLPSHIPDVPGVTLGLRYEPAHGGIEVGGDFYEVLTVGDRMLVAIGDVMGHSLHAATIMAELRHALRASVMDEVDLAASMDLLNKVLRRYHPSMTATVCLMLLNPATGEIMLANAGHIPPLLAGPDARFHGMGNLMLGVAEEDYKVDHLTLPPGATIMMFTDGLVEDRHTLLDDSLERARRLAETVGDDLEAFCDEMLAAFGTREDDVALVVLRRDL
ncbi:fused response regulator/phosphatase [Nonomuraea sp. SBT364]|uniref:fused response regulator/phosphatase n=1 Tax=Nonomuraea sp. SBT364 TaxID=1580530 RepID=UPI00066A13DB|nr:fused response regulator/phosphatase [Nonomuraea sp. SBT364]